MIEFWEIIFLLLAANYVIFISLIFRGLNKLSSDDRSIIGSELTFISVIIPFRNERQNILASLASLESQDYPKDRYELIYVDDNSDDGSAELLESAIKNSNILIFSVGKSHDFNARKKHAIELGLNKAKGEIIFTTDADCTHSSKWLNSMVSMFNKDVGFVSGPVAFKEGETVFEKMQHIEFAGLVISGAGLIAQRKPAICNGANIAFRKDAFDSVGGYSGSYHKASGEDEVIMQKISAQGKYRVVFCTDRDSIVKTAPLYSLGGFINQRRRWASKGLYYKNNFLNTRLALIFLFFLSLALQPFLALFVDWRFIITFIIGMTSKVSIDLVSIKRGMRIIFQKNEIPYFYISELFHIPYIIFVSILGLFGNYSWKGIRVRR